MTAAVVATADTAHAGLRVLLPVEARVRARCLAGWLCAVSLEIAGGLEECGRGEHLLARADETRTRRTILRGVSRAESWCGPEG
jgi:hypothetical protein